MKLLSCGDKCIDAGLRAPKTQTELYLPWSKKVNNAAVGLAIQWPAWTGIFDAEGDQRDKHGDVVAQGIGVSTPFTEYVPILSQQLPLTERTLNMKEVGEALATSMPNYFSIPPTPLALSVPDTPLGRVSNISERGSEVPTPSALSTASTVTTGEILTVDGSITSGSGSATSSYILHPNGASDSTPEMSPTSTSCKSSFGEIEDPSRKHKVRKSLSDQHWVLGPS